MTPQEQQLLDGLIGRVQSTQLAGKDPAAAQRIQSALGTNPDALYILCQTVLVQSYALEQAQKQLADAKDQLASLQQKVQDTDHPGFLEKIFGSSRAPQPSQQSAQTYAPSQPAPAYGNQAYSGPVTTSGYGSPYPPAQAYGNPAGMGAGGMFGGGSGGGFLQGAMQTAAGVAMGEIAVQGVESLMHGFGHAAGYGSDHALGGFGDDNSRNFADDGGNNGDNFGDRLQSADNSGNGLSDDIEDRRGGSGFFGGSDSGNDANSAADLQDNSSFGDGGGDGGGDDNSSFDDSGSGSSDDSF